MESVQEMRIAESRSSEKQIKDLKEECVKSLPQLESDLIRTEPRYRTESTAIERRMPAVETTDEQISKMYFYGLIDLIWLFACLVMGFGYLNKPDAVYPKKELKDYQMENETLDYSLEY